MLKILILGFLIISPIYSYGNSVILSIDQSQKVKDAERMLEIASREY